MSDFSLRKAARRVLDETDLTAPEDIADKVLAMLPAEEKEAVLRFLMISWVSNEVTRRAEFTGARKFDRDGKRTAARSAKVSAIRAAAPKWLRDRVYVGGGRRILLADCSYENLMYLQADRYESAEKFTAVGDKFGQLASLVLQHGVERVADLPAAVLSEFYVQVAA